MKHFLSLLTLMALCLPLSLSAADGPFLGQTAYSPKLAQRFRFRPDGTFRVMQLSDLHLDYRRRNGDLAFETLAKELATYKPDLVILTGDNVFWATVFKPCADALVPYFVKARVPFAVTFGNHDSEERGKGVPTRQEQYDYYKKLGGKYFVDFDISELTGVGNGAIPILNAEGQPVFNLIVMDSGDYAYGDKPKRGYDNVHWDQIRWYEEQAGVLPCLWFQHIIIPDGWNIMAKYPAEARPSQYTLLDTPEVPEGTPGSFVSKELGNRRIAKLPAGAEWSAPLKSYLIPEKDMTWSDKRKCYMTPSPDGMWAEWWDTVAAPNREEGGVGNLKEGLCPPKEPTYNDDEHTYLGRTLYRSWVKMGNLKGAYFGHDHMNTFDGTDKNGIRFGACKSGGIDGYNDGNPGCRIFDIREDGSYDTQTVTAEDLGLQTKQRDLSQM